MIRTARAHLVHSTASVSPLTPRRGTPPAEPEPRPWTAKNEKNEQRMGPGKHGFLLFKIKNNTMQVHCMKYTLYHSTCKVYCTESVVYSIIIDAHTSYQPHNHKLAGECS